MNNTSMSRILLPVLLLVLGVFTGHGKDGDRDPRSNILFIIMDDVGIDQLEGFNPEGSPISRPRTPNIHAVATAGVKFTNFWTMPECSPSRACFFTGRYPFRTGVTEALLFLRSARGTGQSFRDHYSNGAQQEGL